MTGYSHIDEICGDLGPRRHDFYRCYKCGGIFTREHERNVFDLAEVGRGTVCECGSAKYSPTKPRFYEWVYPSVFAYTVKVVLARGLAPWMKKHFPEGLSLVNWLVQRRIR
jgi:DNA-directed RNA polymerase subunit RPC12/RpoP